jgi:hypothetical protein
MVVQATATVYNVYNTLNKEEIQRSTYSLHSCVNALVFTPCLSSQPVVAPASILVINLPLADIVIWPTFLTSAHFTNRFAHYIYKLTPPTSCASSASSISFLSCIRLYFHPCLLRFHTQPEIF